MTCQWSNRRACDSAVNASLSLDLSDVSERERKEFRDGFDGSCSASRLDGTNKKEAKSNTYISWPERPSFFRWTRLP